MAEFTNAVYGEPVEFKVAEGETLAMSRGNKGFFAMGQLSREFDTGLPDGEYCDIISECRQKVQVSGGKAFIGNLMLCFCNSKITLIIAIYFEHFFILSSSRGAMVTVLTDLILVSYKIFDFQDFLLSYINSKLLALFYLCAEQQIN